MRRPRIKAEGEGFYHVVSRIGGKRFLIDAEEKGILLATIRAAAAFSGVELYTFAVMSNHFHLLVRVPRKREVPDAELLRRMEALYGTPRFHKVLEKWEKWNKTNQESRVENEKARLRARMHDLSQFCKTFKETYTQDFNRRHGNTGTIWEGRFKSILLDGSRRAMMTVAGYIHLNPVRAGHGRDRRGRGERRLRRGVPGRYARAGRPAGPRETRVRREGRDLGPGARSVRRGRRGNGSRRERGRSSRSPGERGVQDAAAFPRGGVPARRRAG